MSPKKHTRINAKGKQEAVRYEPEDVVGVFGYEGDKKVFWLASIFLYLPKPDEFKVWWAAPVVQSDPYGSYALQETCSGRKSDITIVDFRCILGLVPHMQADHHKGTLKGALGKEVWESLQAQAEAFVDE